MTENPTQAFSPEPPLKAFPWKALGLGLLISIIVAMFCGADYISNTQKMLMNDLERQATAFAKKDAVHAFVRQHYIGCSMYPSLKDETVCAGAAIAIANEEKGSEFAHAVAHTIHEWDKSSVALSPDTRRRLTLIAHVLPFFKDVLTQ